MGPTIYETAEQAIREADEWDSPIHSIRHVVRWSGGWAVKGHVNCESCPNCDDPHVRGTRHAISLEQGQTNG